LSLLLRAGLPTPKDCGTSTPDVQELGLPLLPPVVVATATVEFVTSRSTSAIPVSAGVALELLAASVVRPRVARKSVRAFQIAASIVAVPTSGIAPVPSCIVRTTAVSVDLTITGKGQSRLALAPAPAAAAAAEILVRVAAVGIPTATKEDFPSRCLPFPPAARVQSIIKEPSSCNQTRS